MGIVNAIQWGLRLLLQARSAIAMNTGAMSSCKQADAYVQRLCVHAQGPASHPFYLSEKNGSAPVKVLLDPYHPSIASCGPAPPMDSPVRDHQPSVAASNLLIPTGTIRQWPITIIIASRLTTNLA